MSNVKRGLENHRKPVENPRDDILRDCRLCKIEHALRKCLKFRKMSLGNRWKTVKKFHYCFNCLEHSHMKDKCASCERCLEWMSEYHNLLYCQTKAKKENKPTTQQQPQNSDGPKEKSPSLRKRNNNKCGKSKKISTPQPQAYIFCMQHPQ